LSEEKKIDVTTAVKQLQKDYDERDCALMLVYDDGFWKLTVRPDYLELVAGLVKKTELDNATMETLALVAYKHPALQSEIIKLRSSYAYEHLKTLENLGFITRERKGRTKVIRLTERFYHYFDINEKERDQFFQTVKAQEQEIEKIKQELLEREETAKEQLKQAAESHDQPYIMPTEIDDQEEEVQPHAEQDSVEAKPPQ